MININQQEQFNAMYTYLLTYPNKNQNYNGPIDVYITQKIL